MRTLVRFGPLTNAVDQVALIRDLTPETDDGPRLVRVEFTDRHTVDLSADASSLLNWAEPRTTDATD